MAYEHLADMAALSRRDMVQTVKKVRPAKARTLATFQEGTRKKQAQLAGIQIPVVHTHAEGSGTYNPNADETSFARMTKERFTAMYGGVVFRYMHMDLEDHIMLDLERGKLPDSYIDKRRRRIDTFMMEKNWMVMGPGTGTVAFTASATGTTLTCQATNSARGTSKGSFRLLLSTTEDPLYYSAINTTTEAEVARFFVTAKPTLTTATVNFTGGIGSITDLNTSGLAIVKTKVGWKKEMIGLAGHISDATSGIYQGADRALHSWLANVGIDAGNAAPTPTMVDSAKNVAMTRANDLNGRNGLICHITPGNWSILCAYGYNSRSYNAEKGQAMKTFGLPADYEDGDTMFFKDPDYEDAYIDFREQAPYFEYVQKEFGQKKTDGIGRHEWVGLNQAGSTESYENYNEAVNIVWDGRGKDGDLEGGGSPNSAVFIYNIALPAIRQTTYGLR